jgi:hypothetical protein
MSYSSAGFYVLGVLLLAAFAASSCLRSPSVGALLAKALAAGIALSVLVACRGGAVLLLPGFALAGVVASWRFGGTKRWGIAVAAALLVLMPTVWLRSRIEGLTNATFATRTAGAAPPQHHAVWFGVWTGLGDFDESKGYVWNDAAASAFLVKKGGTPLAPGSYGERNEEILRETIFADISSDPLWYARILAKRFGSALVQWPVLPWTPLGGVAGRFPNDGIASYYTLTAHVDVIRLYPAEIELPFLVLVVSSAALLFLRARPEVLWLTTVLCGALVLPVGITTGGAIEPMAAGLAFFTGAALFADVVAKRVRGSRG